MKIHGSKLSCTGIYGDGCGGGREFFIDNQKLYVFDPITQETFILFDGIIQATSITKSGCIITIDTKTKPIYFDLSKLQVVEKIQ